MFAYEKKFMSKAIDKVMNSNNNMLLLTGFVWNQHSSVVSN